MDFLTISGCYIQKVASRKYRYAIQIENLVFAYKLSMNTPIFS